MKIFNKTEGFCPICKKVINADIVEKNGAIFMEKKCPEHGDFEAKIAKYAWYYEGLNNFYNKLYSKNFYEKNQRRLYTSIVSTECTLKCPICFANFGKVEKEGNISTDFFKKYLMGLKNQGVFIHLSGGGEPTLREDLPELIRLISKSGNAALLFTNGIRIANDFDYLKKIKNSGLKSICIWMDTLKNEEIHKKMRGGDFIGSRMKALENIKKVKIPVRILQVVARGFNEGEIGDIMEFVRKNDFINSFQIRGYNYWGKCGLSPVQEFGAVDELVEVAASQSNGLFTLKDVYCFQKILYVLSVFFNIPRCYRAQLIMVPRNEAKSLRDTFRFEEFSKYLDELELLWHKNSKKAKIYFFSKCLPKLLRNPALFYLLIKMGTSKFGWSSFSSKYYCAIGINSVYNLLNYDIQKAQQQCPNRSFNLGPENNIPRCYELFSLYDYR